MVISKFLFLEKSVQVFISKSFVSNLLRFPKSASRFLAKVLAGKWFYLTKFVFSGLHFVWSSQVSEIGFKIFSKSFGMFGSGFSPGLFFLAK